MQGGVAGTHRRLCFGPNFSFDTAAADSSRNFAVLKKDHLCAALLRCRTTRVRHGCDHDAFATFGGFVDHTIEIAHRVRRHLILLCVLPFGELVYVSMATTPNIHRRISDRPLYLL